jgi:hypothetical protein
MSDFGRTAGPEVLVAGGQDLDVLLGPLAAYLHALEARVGALEAQTSAVPLMTAADAAAYARVNVRRSCGRSGPVSSRSPAMSAARPGSLAMPSTAGLPRDHQRRHRFLCSPAGVAAKGKRCRRGGMASAGLNVARQLGHGSWLTLETYGQVDGRVQRSAKARRGGRHNAGAQRPASRASGLDRIVDMMSASGPHKALPSNWGRGATMGPSGCSAQSPPVVFRSCCCTRLQGSSASWNDWRGQRVFLIRKRSQVRVLDRPSAGIQEFAAFAQCSGFGTVNGSGGPGA